MPGIRDSEAESYSVFIERAGKSYLLDEFEVGVEFETRVRVGSADIDQHELGRELDRGDWHLATMLGLEFGWLQQHDEFKDLEVLVVTQERGGTVIPSAVYVGNPAIPTFADLKDKRLAVFHSQPLTDTAYLKWLLDKQGAEYPNEFFESTTEYDTAREAIHSVANQQCDCMVMSAATAEHLRAIAPVGRLSPLIAKDFPSVAMVGSPREVQKILGRDGWDQLRATFLRLHTDKGARRAMDQFGFQRYITAGTDDGGFFSAMERCATEIPASTVAELETFFDER